jgi:hypothetical protein
MPNSGPYKRPLADALIGVKEANYLGSADFNGSTLALHSNGGGVGESSSYTH